jgi:hypothetical protein
MLAGNHISRKLSFYESEFKIGEVIEVLLRPGRIVITQVELLK